MIVVQQQKKGRVIVGSGSFVDKNTVAVTQRDGNVVHVKVFVYGTVTFNLTS